MGLFTFDFPNFILLDVEIPVGDNYRSPNPRYHVKGIWGVVVGLKTRVSSLIIKERRNQHYQGFEVCKKIVGDTFFNPNR